MELTEYQLDKVGHALGINVYHARLSKRKKDSILPDEFYRNYYCVGKQGSELNQEFKDLESKGIIETWNKFSNLNFSITGKGIELFREQFQEEITDNFKPLSRSKNRYQEYLDCDNCCDFTDWLGITPPALQYAGNKNPYKWVRGDLICMPKMSFDSSGYRYFSIKYPEVIGGWCKTRKEAKVSYKERLKNHLRK